MKKLLVLLAVVTMVMMGVLPVWATDYYVANSGSDSNSGLIYDPWKTIAHVNSATEINSGDVIHFLRGNTWRIPEDAQLIPRSGVTYTAYDVLDKPLFLGSVEKNSTTDWEEYTTNIWFTTDSSFLVVGQDVGNIIFNNEKSTGDWKPTFADLESTLAEQGDFYYEESSSTLYLYSVDNPADVYSDIECAVDIKLIDIAGKSDVTISNLDLRYTSAHAIWVRGGSNNITVKDNDISYIGGALQGTVASAPRYGNGIELWNDVNNIWVNHNRVWEIYDAALTNQGLGAALQYNIYFQYNVVWNSAYSYEYFPKADGNNNVMQVYGIYVENNTFVNAGDGWSYPEDPRGYLLKFWNQIGNVEDPNNVGQDTFFIRNNILYQDNIIHAEYDEERVNRCLQMPAVIPNLTLDYNTWYKPVNGMIDYAGSIYWMADFPQYQIDSGWDANSIAADPILIDVVNHNYRLQDISPSIDKALDVGQTQDFDYNPIILLPDMGAFEFSATYTITATAGPNGSISPSGDVIVNTGADQTFKITADPDYQIAEVLVDGEALNFIAIFPFTQTSYTFTNVTSTHTIEASFEYIATITATAGPDGSISPSGDVIVEQGADQTFEITADTGYQIADVVVDDVSKGPISTYTFTSVTDDHSINATFSVDPDISATPASKDFGSVAVGSVSTSQIFTISNDGTADLAIGGVYLTGTNPYQFSIQSENCQGQTLAPSGSCTIEVRYEPTKTGTMYASIGVDSNDPDTPNLYIDLTGTGVQANPDISAAPASKDFGSVAVGSVSPSQIFTISNDGTADLVIGGVYLTGTNPYQFSIQSENCQGQTLAPSGSCTIKAVYKPTKTGTMYAKIGVDSDDPDTPNLYIDLTGTGY